VIKMALEDTINREPLSDLFRRMRADYDSGKYFEDARGAIPVTDGFRIPNGAKKRLSDAEAKVIGVYGDAGSIAERINAYLHQTKNFFFSRILRKRIDESLLERISRDVKELGYANAEIIPAIKQGERARDSLAEQNRGLWLGMAELAEKKLFAEKAYDKLVEERNALEQALQEAPISERIRGRMALEGMEYKKREMESNLAYFGRQIEFSDNAVKSNESAIKMLEDYVVASQEVLNLSQLTEHQLCASAEWVKAAVLLPRAGRLLESMQGQAEGALNRLYQAMARIADENFSFVARHRSFAVYRDGTLEDFKRAAGQNHKGKCAAHEESYQRGNRILNGL